MIALAIQICLDRGILLLGSRALMLLTTSTFDDMWVTAHHLGTHLCTPMNGKVLLGKHHRHDRLLLIVQLESSDPGCGFLGEISEGGTLYHWSGLAHDPIEIFCFIPT